MTDTHRDTSRDGPQTAAWPLVRRMLGLAWVYRWGCVRIILLQLGLLSLGMLGLGLTGLGVDTIRYELAARPGLGLPLPQPPRWPFGLIPPEEWGPMVLIAVIALAILFLAALRSGLNITYTVAVNRLLQGRVVVELRSRVYRKMQTLSFTFFDTNASGSIINRVTSDVQSVRSFIDGVVVQSLILFLSLCVYVVYMAGIHGTLTVVCLISTPLLWFSTSRFSRAVRPAYAESRVLHDNEVLALSENIRGVHVVKGFARQQEEIAKFNDAVEQVNRQKHWIFWKISIFQPLITLLSQVNLVVLLAYGGYLVILHERGATTEGISVGQLLVFAGLLQQFSGQVANIAAIADSMQQSLVGAQRVFEVLDTPIAVKSPPAPVQLPEVRGDVAFENVGFEHKPGAAVLHDVTFSVKAGQCIAILGATGAGKTTLLSLIPRFYDATSGVVKLDGHDVRTLDLEVLRRSAGIVFQENFLFSNTVRANIAFGFPDATQEQVEAAARIAAAHEFILELPHGYDTLLREGGSNLSGGQRQRIAIARALLHNPRILLLDDPTASIDAQTEAEIMLAMHNAMQGRTTFIVAHRLSTLRRADCILVLSRGRLIESGTHDELMARGGLYRRAAEIQLPDSESLELLDETEVRTP